MLKEHNADYLSDNALKWHKKFGIHGANVAPEFGVCETKAIQQEIGIEQWQVLQQLKSIKQIMGQPQARLPIFELNQR